MAYSKHEWNAGEAITAPKMNTLEAAVQNVAALADKLVTDTGKDTGKESLQKQINDANSSITTVSTWIDGPGDRLLAEVEGSGGLMAQVTGLHTSTENGEAAWQQVASVITRDSQGNVQTSLKKVVDDIKTDITAVNNTIGAGYSADNTISAVINTEITARRSNDDAIRELITNAATGQESFYGSEAPTTLQQRVADLMTGIDRKANQSALSTATTAIGNQAKDIANIQSEIKAAHRSENDTLDARLDDIEAAATTAATTAAQYNDETYVKKSQIKDSLDIDASGDVLDARQGKILNTHITKIETALDGFIDTKTVQSKFDALENWVNGKIVDSDKINTVISPGDSTNVTSAKVGKQLYSELSNARISQAIRTPGQNEGDPDTDTTYNSLDERLEAIEGRANTASDAFEQLQTEILTARASNVKGTEDDETHEVTPLEYGSLDARFEAAEGDIHKIASELKMYNQAGAIQDATTRIDTIEKNVLEMGKEIGMITDLETVQTLSDTIDRASTYIDKVKNEIAGAHRTDEDTLSARFNAVESSVSGLNSTITNAETGLAKTKEIADEALGKANAAAVATEVTSALAGKASTESVNNLTNRVSTLESATTIIMSVSDFNALAANAENSTKDYLVGPDEDNLYKYYRIIETSSNTYTKVLISGGNSGESGGGNSSGFVYTEAQYNDLDTKAENTDYYVLRADGYHHYRWVGEEEIEIDEPTKRYNIALETIESDDGNLNYLNFYEFNPGENYVITDDTDLTEIVNNRTRHILLPSTGSGGGAVNTMKIIPITSRNTYNAYNSNLPVKIRFFFTTGDTGEGASYNFTVNGTTILSQSVNITSGNPENRAYTWPIDKNEEELSAEEAAKLGFYEFNVGPYCQDIGTYAIKLTIALDSNTAITAEATWNVQTINLSLISNFTNSPVAALNEQVAFTYIPSGNIEKTAHFILDGTPLPTVTIPARTNTTQTYNIPAQSAGAYKLEVYLTANNGAIKTSSIYRDIIWHDTSSSDIIIASPYRGNIEKVKQYDALSIPYTVVGGNTSTYTVKYYVDDLNNNIDEVVLNNTNSGVWNYIANLTEGNHTLMIKVNEASISFTLQVTDLGIDISPVTNNLAIDFNPTGITNSSTKRLWTNGIYSLSVSDNFDWYNGGYGSDTSGDYFLIKSGTRAYFDYKMFKSYDKEINGAMTTKSTVFRDGAEMKIIFKTSAVRNAEAVWFSNVGANNTTSAAKNVGIQLNVHNGWLRTDSANKDNVKSYLYFPYSEEDRIELDININPETATNSVYCMSYEDGCPSRAYPYKSTEEIYQVSDEESPITIGSDDCDVYVYRFKIYTTALDTEEVLRNFIADGKDVTTCKERYERNSIYYDTQLEEYTPYEGPDTILDPERLAVKLPDVKILMLDTPIFTKSKKDFIKDSSLRCIHAPGGKVYPSRGKEDNWFFGNGYHAGQGTTSDKYGDAGRNVDFLFNCDGIHNPSDKVKDETFVPGYQSYVIKGYGTAEQEEPEYCTDWKGDDGKVSLTSTSIPNNFFNLKVNIASSENVNNALFQKRYNDFLLYDSPAHQRDSRIKNDMEFVPAILFVRENKIDEQGNPDGHREFADTNWHFYALGNLGDSKKSDYTRAYDPTDANEFTLEISDNNTNNSQFQTGVYIKNGVRTIEPYTIVDDVDDDGKLTGTQSAKSEEEDITLETTAYLYPIDKETEWEAVDENGKPKNMRYWGLMNEKFDGDHSFEMRYAYLGNYRDGKLVNGDKTTANAILERNSNVWRAFYTWLVTSSNEEFRNEIDQWCVRRSMAFFYAFTHYYTMIDNRAKNTFWHFAKTGKHRKVTQPVKALLHIYEEANGTVTPSLNDSDVFEGNFVPTTDTAVVQPYFVDQYTLVTASKFSANVTYYTYNNNQYTFTEVTAGDDIPSNIAYYTHSYVLTNDTTIQSGTVYYKLINHIYTPAEVTVGDPIKQYYTQYAFDMWAYDMDTAAGIDNNGELIFPYGKEDTDDRVDGVATSGKVFNGAGSVFWARLRENLTADITGAFTGANTSCFNAENLITEFDKVQNCYPEAIWRLDVERKYIRSFTGDDGSTEDHPEPIYLTRQNTRFLGDMMQGRKKYQRRQWVKDQGVYFGSKYKMLNVMDSQLDMVCYTIANQSVKANWDLTITPYQDIYINVDYGETPIAPIRAKANTPVEIDCPFPSMNESRVRVYGADYIRTLAGKPIKDDQGKIIGANSLASLYFRANAFNHTNKLRELYIGSPDPTYDNSQFTTLNLNPNSPILEVLDLQNCSGLSGALSVSGCTSLKTVNIQGTSYSSIDLPSSTGIENLYLPNTMNRLILTAAKNLTNLTIRTRIGDTDNVDNLTEMIINDSDYTNNVNWMSIAANALVHLTNLQLINLRLASIKNIDELQSFAEKKKDLGNFINDSGEEISKINLTGVLNVTGNWSDAKINTYKQIWPKLDYNTQAEKEITEYKLSFYLNADDAQNKTNVYYTSYLTVEEGMTDTTLGNDPVYIGLCSTPTKEPTISKEYYFGENPNTYYPWSGWRIKDSAATLKADLVVSEDLVLIAVFGEQTRTYPLRWYLNSDDTEPVKEVLGVEYNSSYEIGLAPTAFDLIQAGKTLSAINGADYTYRIFTGWEKEPINLDNSYFNKDQTAFCIYGTWEQGNESIESIKAQEELDEKKLLVLTNTNDKVRTSITTYTVEMGYDNNTGTTIIGKNATLGISPRGEVYTGEDVDHPVLRFIQYNGQLVPGVLPVNDIKPFSKMSSEGFTLVIDYQIDTAYVNTIYNSGYCILCGCYANNSGDGTAQGFAIYYDVAAGIIKACFGDLTSSSTYSSASSSCAITNVASANKRNIVTIRHRTGENTLQFYSGISASTQGLLLNLSDNSFSGTPITWSSNIITSPLCFGHFTSSNFTALSAVHPGVGTTIHWAKYWDKDLGHNECTLLASWPHENITFALSDYSNDNDTDILVTNSRNMIFSALQLSEYGGPYYESIQASIDKTVNWGTDLGTKTNSTYKKISNQRFFLGLPIKLQSIITPTLGHAATINGVSNNAYTSQVAYEYKTTGDTTDLAFIPSYVEVGGTDSDYYSEALRAFPWYSASNTQIFNYNTNTFDFENVSNSREYMNLRFNSIPIKTAGINNIFAGYNGTDPVYNKINIATNPNGGIIRGDIFIHTYTSNNSTITNAYIYADNLDVAKGAQVINAAAGELLYCPVGGWIKAGSWWTRTPASTQGTRVNGSQPFFYIDGSTGSIKYNSTPAENGAYFVYEFGI